MRPPNFAISAVIFSNRLALYSEVSCANSPNSIDFISCWWASASICLRLYAASSAEIDRATDIREVDDCPSSRFFASSSEVCRNCSTGAPIVSIGLMVAIATRRFTIARRMPFCTVPSDCSRSPWRTRLSRVCAIGWAPYSREVRRRWRCCWPSAVDDGSMPNQLIPSRRPPKMPSRLDCTAEISVDDKAAARSGLSDIISSCVAGSIRRSARSRYSELGRPLRPSPSCEYSRKLASFAVSVACSKYLLFLSPSASATLTQSSHSVTTWPSSFSSKDPLPAMLDWCMAYRSTGCIMSTSPSASGRTPSACSARKWSSVSIAAAAFTYPGLPPSSGDSASFRRYSW